MIDLAPLLLAGQNDVATFIEGLSIDEFSTALVIDGTS